jgi:hypothetical protein
MNHGSIETVPRLFVALIGDTIDLDTVYKFENQLSNRWPICAPNCLIKAIQPLGNPTRWRIEAYTSDSCRCLGFEELCPDPRPLRTQQSILALSNIKKIEIDHHQPPLCLNHSLLQNPEFATKPDQFQGLFGRSSSTG